MTQSMKAAFLPVFAAPLLSTACGDKPKDTATKPADAAAPRNVEAGQGLVLLRGDTSVPLVYHVGFDENYKLVSIELTDHPVESRSARLNFRVDVLRLFQGEANVDMAALPAVKFDRTDAARLARNFAAMIAPMRADAP